jgi:hypothetical protein
MKEEIIGSHINTVMDHCRLKYPLKINPGNKRKHDITI